jgi:hypothetical protein
VWAPDGKRLFYIDNQSGLGHVAAVDVSLQPGFAASNPVALPIEAMFPETIRPYDIMPDGKRFLVAVPEADAKNQTGTLRVTMNWFDELSSRVASGR